MPVAVGAEILRFGADVEAILKHVLADAPAIGEAARIARGDRRQREAGGDHCRRRRLGPEFRGEADADGAALETVARIVRPQFVSLEIEAEKDLGFNAMPLDAESRQDLRRRFRTHHALAAEIAGAVAIEAAREQDLQQQPVVVEAAWSGEETAIGKEAVAPEVSAGEQDDRSVVNAAGHAREARQPQGRGGERRAPAPTHDAPPTQRYNRSRYGYNLDGNYPVDTTSFKG